MEKKYKLELNLQNINVILKSLSELPLKTSFEAFVNIRGQVESQTKEDEVKTE